MVPAIEMVVAVPPDVGLAELVAVAPDTQFVASDIPDLPPAANLTTISTQAGRPDQQGFIAGEIAAMLSEDWRVGAISLSDTTEGRSARSGFVNGVVYFCGLCRPIHPPFYEYPTYVELPATATSAEWQEAANYMVDHAVRSVYVYPQAGDEAMLSILAQAGINIIGGIEPPASVASSWAVSLTSDPITFIQEQVAGLLDGSISGGQTLTVPIQFTNINPSIFTPGKQSLAQQTLSDLQAGYIDTSVDLTTGENRP
jgi:basic membrane lipoprotein Med (substrate-binding protein (PBP1-ABC) superfamily)